MLSSTDKEWLFKLLERNMRSMYQQVRARHVLDYLKSRIWNLSSLFKLLKRSIRSGVIRILGLTSIYLKIQFFQSNWGWNSANKRTEVEETAAW